MKDLQAEKKIKARNMYRVVGLENSPKNDRNLYRNLEQADLHAPTTAYLEKVKVIEIYAR